MIPQSLAEIVGQPPVRHLAAYCESVKRGAATSKCFILHGPQGTGKTASALACAAELGCEEVRFGGGLTVVDCSDYGVKDYDELFGRTLKLSVCSPYRWRVVILEEFERLSKESQVKLKFYLDGNRIPQRMLLIATSNELKGFGEAVLDRFKVMPFSNGDGFMAECQKRLKHLWAMRCQGEGLPMGFTGWGRSFERAGFSMRSALASLEEALAERELVAA